VKKEQPYGEKQSDACWGIPGKPRSKMVYLTSDIWEKKLGRGKPVKTFLGREEPKRKPIVEGKVKVKAVRGKEKPKTTSRATLSETLT